MRDIIEYCFEVALVRDAVACGVKEEGDGYLADMVNWRFMSNDVLTTEETIKYMKAVAA
jgi:nicotinamidase-related amidase